VMISACLIRDGLVLLPLRNPDEINVTPPRNSCHA
jgi:hypothetical protein